jgi:hypothetical protein
MKRVLNLPADVSPSELIARLRYTTNRDPVWGEPARSLTITDWDYRRNHDRTWRVEFAASPARAADLPPADWSGLADAAPLGEGTADDRTGVRESEEGGGPGAGRRREEGREGGGREEATGGGAGEDEEPAGRRHRPRRRHEG